MGIYLINKYLLVQQMFELPMYPRHWAVAEENSELESSCLERRYSTGQTHGEKASGIFVCGDLRVYIFTFFFNVETQVTLNNGNEGCFKDNFPPIADCHQ